MSYISIVLLVLVILLLAAHFYDIKKTHRTHD
jgi:hypothetical protein